MHDPGLTDGVGQPWAVLHNPYGVGREAAQRCLGLTCGLALALLLSGALGCQQKMALQPSYQPDDASDFFSDGKASRPPPAGTVARGHLSVDAALFTGRKSLEEPTTAPRQAREEQADRGGAKAVLAGEAAQFEGVVDEFPFPITREILEHGRDRFMIYCVVCHDAAGTGFGKIVERGYTRPPSYHIDRLRQAPVGHIFRVISQGYGSMPSYAGQIPTRDRWAIVAYVRALQLSQHFPVEKLPDDMRQEWNESQKRDLGRRGDRSPNGESVASFPGSAWQRTDAEALPRRPPPDLSRRSHDSALRGGRTPYRPHRVYPGGAMILHCVAARRPDRSGKSLPPPGQARWGAGALFVLGVVQNHGSTGMNPVGASPGARPSFSFSRKAWERVRRPEGGDQ